MPNIPCQQCSNLFYCRPSHLHRRKTCSNKCKRALQGLIDIEINCPMCGILFNTSTAVNARKTCSKKCGKTRKFSQAAKDKLSNLRSKPTIERIDGVYHITCKCGKVFQSSSIHGKYCSQDCVVLLARKSICVRCNSAPTHKMTFLCIECLRVSSSLGGIRNSTISPTDPDMARICKKCKINKIPYSKIIDGKSRKFANRTSCLECVPFKHSPYSSLSDEEIRKIKRAKNAKKSRNYYKRYAYKNAVIYSTKKRTDRKNGLVEFFGGCQVCNYSRCARNLTFHHVDSSTKEFVISSRSLQFRWAKVKKEILKCVFICHRCHGETHDGLIEHSVVLGFHDKLRDLIAPLDFWPNENKPEVRPKTEYVTQSVKVRCKNSLD